MNQDTFNLNNKVYSNNNNLLFGIINDLQQVINNTNDNLVIKRIGDIITKMNFIINENRKNTQLIMNQIALLQNKFDQVQNQLAQMNKNIANININNINHQKLIRQKGRYVGQVVNGIKEGKGIFYWNNGNRYEGDCRNGKIEGKGIKYFSNGDRMIGDYYNDKPVGKHVILTKNGDVKIENY